jgi:tyrosine-protein kinase Etk/Wzc
VPLVFALVAPARPGDSFRAALGTHPVAQDAGAGVTDLNVVLTVLGILVVVAITWGVLKARGSRVTSVDDLEGSTGLVVIGTIPHKGFLRPGPATDGQPLPPAADGMQRIRRMLEHNGLGAEIRVVTIVPGSTRRLRSDFATALSHSLVDAGHEVVLVHANMRPPTARSSHNDFSKGLAVLLEDDGDDPVSLLVSVRQRLLMLPPGTPQEDPAALLTGPRLGKVIESLRQLGLNIIIDAPPANFTADVMALAREADVTLLIIQTGSRWNEVEQAARMLRYGDTGDPAAVLVGTRRWGSLAVGIRSQPGIDSGNPV